MKTLEPSEAWIHGYEAAELMQMRRDWLLYGNWLDGLIGASVASILIGFFLRHDYTDSDP